MSQQIRLFERRVSRIERAYANRIPNTYSIRADGLVVPKRRSRLRFRFPLRALISGFLCAIFLKGFLIYQLGEASYTARIDTMLAGTTYEQMAAQILMPESVSLWVADQFQRLVILAHDI